MPNEALAARARALEAMVGRASFLSHLGAEIRFDDEFRSVVTLPHRPHLEHAKGGVHGGVLATLIDAAAWCAAAVHYPSWIATVEFDVRLLEPVIGEDLIAVGRAVRIGKRIAVAETEVRTAAGRLVAVGAATLSTTGLPID
jgi:acyl-CoA thioesterase